ncbi:MAG TPA: hemolysin III family protein [Thermoanaerobaculia bacterium]|nr:hemolysin III family protein [Thermoanaerobaculia bacterium]
MTTHASRAEEIANAVTHGVGTVLFAAGAVVLITLASLRGDAWVVVSCSVFAASLVLFYTVSTLYHAFRGPRVKGIFRRLDHAAIFLVIAGSYTPFLLVSLHGTWGWTLFGVVWGLAVLGIVFKSLWTGKLPILSTALYVVMGWCIVVAWRPLTAAVPPAGVAWLIAGGVIYSAGVAFYALDRRIRWAHPVWHVFVLAASACHFVAVLFYVVPPRA